MDITVIFYLIGALVLRVTFAQLGRSFFGGSDNEKVLVSIAELFAGLVAFTTAIFMDMRFPSDWRIYATLGLACVLYALNDSLGATTKKYLEVSVLAVIWQLSSVFLVVIGFVIFRDTYMIEKILGTILIIIGNIILVFKKNKFEVNRYILLAIFVEFIFASAVTIDVGISENFNLLFYIGVTLTVPALLNILMNKINLSALSKEFKNTNKLMLGLYAIVWTSMIYFLITAYQKATLTVAVPILASSVLLNVVLGLLIHKETKDIKRKLIAAIIVVAGIIFTVMDIPWL